MVPHLQSDVVRLLPSPESDETLIDGLRAAADDVSRDAKSFNDGVVANLSGSKTIVSAFGKKLYYYCLYPQS